MPHKRSDAYARIAQRLIDGIGSIIGSQNKVGEYFRLDSSSAQMSSELLW